MYVMYVRMALIGITVRVLITADCLDLASSGNLQVTFRLLQVQSQRPSAPS